MPPKYVKSIREELLYEYAKLMSRSAFQGQIQYGFVTNKFKELKSGSITMSGTIREWQREQELPKVCVFCNATENLQTDHLIPKSRGGSDSADNLVLSCQTCNNSRSGKGIFEWLGLKEKDKLHRLVAGKYLKELYELHTVKGTLEVSTTELHSLCVNCKNPEVCKEWDKVGELTCFCLESIF
ncbi:MAG: HNH endonuclease [Bacteroidota bacterium]